MGKPGKWIKSFWAGKKERAEKDQKNSNGNQPISVDQNPTNPKEKKRWSFRRSSAAAAVPKDPIRADAAPAPPELDHDKHANANDTAAMAAETVAPLINLAAAPSDQDSAIEEAAAIKIQSFYRSYLARKALKALRGLVKLQALVRGHLVRKQATATLRCMQALVTAQARARVQRILAAEEGRITNHRHSTNNRTNSHEKIKHTYQDMEENIKIVEMDQGEFRSSFKARSSSYSISGQQQQSVDRMDNRISTYYPSQRAYSKQDYQQFSPAPSAITGMSPRTCSGHFEDYAFATAKSSPQCYSAMSRPDPSRTPFSFPRPDYAETMSYDYPLYPNYMANTESSRAKARSQSAPKQRPELERQPSRGRRASVEGRNIPRGARMQRSSSHVGSTAPNYQYPWSVKLDKSTVSLKESECGSTCSALTNANYCRSLVSVNPRY